MSTDNGTAVDFDPAEFDVEDDVEQRGVPPIWTRRIGFLECSIWQGVSKNGFATFSTKLRKSWKTDQVTPDGKAIYKPSPYLFQQELSSAALLMNMAAEHIANLMARNRKK